MGSKRKKATVEDAEIKKTSIMLEALEGEQDRLTQWELGFTTSIQDWFYNSGRPLTPGQFEWLEKIYRKYF